MPFGFIYRWSFGIDSSWSFGIFFPFWYVWVYDKSVNPETDLGMPRVRTNIFLLGLENPI
jgi:hypothetical protein